MTKAKNPRGVESGAATVASPRTPAAKILSDAAAASRFAPSIHNTQPWEWRLRAEALDLRANSDRWLKVADPEKRLLIVSCGTALHYCRGALAARGWDPDVVRFPDPRQPMLLATVGLGSRVGIRREDLRHFHAMMRRRTDRRGLDAREVDGATLETLRRAVESESARLHLVPSGDVTELVRIMQHARELEDDAPQQVHERENWVGGDQHAQSGIPAPVLTGLPDHGRVPPRFGDPLVPGDDRHGRYVIVFTDSDTPSAWLSAGEALNHLWLAATEAGLAVLPMSLPLEFDATRELLRQLLSGTGYPVMILRLGYPAPLPQPAWTPRFAEGTVVRTEPS